MASSLSLAAIRVSMMVVFLGWLIVWIMIPTKLYKNEWLPELKKKFSTPTSYGMQGTNLFLLSFPIMLMAVVGCLYVHWKTKQGQSFTTRPKKKRDVHVAVIPPLGIVTAMEFFFLVMFIVLLIWSLGNYIYTSFTGHLHTDKEGLAIWKSKFRSVALRLGYIGNICWAFLFFPVARGSSILPLFGLTSESSIKYHIWLGHISMGLFTAHTIGFLIYWGAMLKDAKNQLKEWSSEWVPNVAGEIAIVFALAMWITSIGRVRRKMFELFYYTHHLYILYILFYLLHVGAHFFAMILPGIFLFLIDRYLRFLQSRKKAMLLSSRRLPNGTFELNFAKSPGLVYNPASTLFLNVPSVSKLQWHPFTVTSNNNMESDRLSVVISSLGSWSSRLYEQLHVKHLEVAVEGPYGPTSCEFFSHELLVFVTGGSGITPFISVFREIVFQSSKPDTVVPKILLICAFKKTADLATLNLLLPVGSSGTETKNIQLQVEAYITREQEQPNAASMILEEKVETISYKPAPGDVPIRAALGPNGWLWLAAIIVSSFGMFLLLLAMVFRYYIRPYQRHHGEGSYHFSYFVLWDIFLVCGTVLVASSVAFLLQKNCRETNPVQSYEGTTPEASPAPMLTQAYTDLESLPLQSIAEVTNVHFGGRPDLKNILLGFKETDVGVVACGPRKMMQDVARICSSSEAVNLRFEAISFNW